MQVMNGLATAVDWLSLEQQALENHGLRVHLELSCHCGHSVVYFNAIQLFDEISSAIALGEIRNFKKKSVCN